MRLAGFLALLSAWLALPVLAQTPSITIPGGLIYQSAAQAGLVYITPTAATAIVVQKAGLNWKSIGLQVLTDGSIAAVAGGLSGVVSISKPILTGLAVGHGFVDQVVAPILGEAAPSGLSNFPPVLAMNGSVAVTSGVCAEATIFASQFKTATGTTVTAKAMLKKKATAAPIAAPITLSIMGATVSFTPQTETVLKNAAGSNIKQFIPVDVLACEQPAPLAPGIGSVQQPRYPGMPQQDEAVNYNADILAKVMLARGAAAAAYANPQSESWLITQKPASAESLSTI
jgi:hypothetical protein